MDSISESEIVTWSISDHARVTLRSSLLYGIEGLELGQPRGLLCLVCEVEHLSEAVDENKF